MCDAYSISEPSHWLYQLACAFLLLSYAVSNIFYLRVLLTAGSFCFTLWGAFVLCVSVDTVVWNALFTLINLFHVVYLVYGMRPIRFDPELEAVYQHFFVKGGLQLARADFKALLVDHTSITELEAGKQFAPVGSERDALCLVLSGRLAVYRRTKNGDEELVHHLNPLEFVDSPEFIARSTARGPIINVAIRAMANNDVETAAPSSYGSIELTSPASGDALVPHPSYLSPTVTNRLPLSQQSHRSGRCRLLVMSYTSIHQLRTKNVAVRSAIDAMVSVDVTQKLFQSTQGARADVESMNTLVNAAHALPPGVHTGVSPTNTNHNISNGHSVDATVLSQTNQTVAEAV